MQNGRFVALTTKDLQTLNLRFDKAMFNSLVSKWERIFEVTFGIFSVLASQINVLENTETPISQIYLCPYDECGKIYANKVMVSDVVGGNLVKFC